ncbi:YbjN domain-containing protein [Orrella sp. 11846]|uniref:YbjN domain-containing protein n=1 Tax=Orrella sp. 11846 TaxID=3409913 RepID=UPI003B5B4C93
MLWCYAVSDDIENVPFERLNKWNSENPYSRTYIDKDGDAVIKLNLDLVDGVIKARRLGFFKTCQNLIVEWHKEVLDQ